MTDCFHRASGRIDRWPDLIPCDDTSANGVSTCCAPKDSCLPNGLCHFTHAAAQGTGYYIGACTDATYKDEKCLQQNQCKDQEWPDIIYSPASRKWSCCGTDLNSNGGPLGSNCSKATSINFDAPSPQELLANTIPFLDLSKAVSSRKTSSSTSSLSQSTSLSASSTSQITSASASSSSSLPSLTPIGATSSNGAEGGGLSTGAKAGIGVGVALAGIIIIGLAIWGILLRRRVNRLKNTEAQPVQSSGRYEMPVAVRPHQPINTEKKLPYTPGQTRGGGHHELSSHQPMRYEIQSDTRHELPGGTYT